MKMTARQRVLTGCAVLVLGATMAWITTLVPLLPEALELAPAQNQIIDLSEKTLQEIAELIEELP